MAYAIIDYHNLKWSHAIKQMDDVGELQVLLPHFKEKSSQKYGKKVLTILNHADINKLVISNEILRNRTFCDVLYGNKKSIITGRRMYKSLILRLLKDVSFQMEMEIKQLKVVLLVDDYSVENVDLIKTIAKEVKSLSVVTTDKDRFEMLVHELFEQYGIVVKIFEKRMGNFQNAHIIVNADFPEYDMNQIIYSNHCLLICGFAKKFQVKSNFNGIVIKDIDVVDMKNRNHHIDDLSLCEAKIYSDLRKMKENDRVFERNGFKINGYFGENGKIRKEEFQKLGKILLDK